MTTSSSPTEGAISPALAWLDAEMDRIWLLGEICLRKMQQAGLRPREHAALGDLEAIFASRRAAQRAEGGGETGPDLEELTRALTACIQPGHTQGRKQARYEATSLFPIGRRMRLSAFVAADHDRVTGQAQFQVGVGMGTSP